MPPARRPRVAADVRTHVPFTVDEVVGRLGVTPEGEATAWSHGSSRRGHVVNGEFRPGGIEREWCDAGVLRSLRRRSLAALRHEVEPVDAVTFVRFLSGVAGRRAGGGAGMDALVEALEQLQGVAIPVSVLERDVLPAVRVEGYQPAMLDELCAAGELVWTGAGALGADDGRVRAVLPRPREAARRASVTLPDPPDGPGARRDPRQLADRRVVLARSGRRRRHRRRRRVPHRAVGSRVGGRGHQRHVRPAARAAAGIGPARALVRTRSAAAPRSARPAPGAGHSSHRCSSPRRRPPRPRTPLPCSCSNATAWSPAKRVKAEGTPGGFAAVYPVLRALEESGRARRGGFVAGLGAAQFALPGAVDRLRAHRTPRHDEPGRGASVLRRYRSRAAVRRRDRLAGHRGRQPPGARRGRARRAHRR